MIPYRIPGFFILPVLSLSLSLPLASSFEAVVYVVFFADVFLESRDLSYS